MENKFYFEVGTLLRNRTIPKNLKIKIYMTLLRPGILYGSDMATWAQRKTAELSWTHLKGKY